MQMPYSLPSTGRPGHRRSFSTEAGPGAFASLGALPRRTATTHPKFHLNEEESSNEEDDLDLQHDSHVPPPLKLKIHHQHHVPFPRSSPISSPLSPVPQITLTTAPIENVKRPTPSRTSSTPILLSNGKPLKSSLKSSNSSPSIYNTHTANPISHLRARSEPATPNPDILSSPPSSTTSVVTTPKNVHFPSLSSDLESVKVFNRSAKPASLLSVRGDETETETEGESSASTSTGWSLGGFMSSSLSRGFPFPRINSPRPLSPLNPQEYHYLLELGANPVPTPNPDAYGNVFLEAFSLSPSPVPPTESETTTGVPFKSVSSALYLHGTLLVRNISFEKHLSIRFTLDEWDTTSEVTAKYLSSLSSPPPFLLPRTLGDLISDIPTSFDRFVFTIRLSDYLPHYRASSTSPPELDVPLTKKRLFLAIRYTVPGQGEWWDNCGGKNWVVGFRVERMSPKKDDEVRERSVSVPAVVPNVSFLAPPQSGSPALHERGLSEPLPSQSPQHKAVEIATNARLSKFKLMNYAAPKSRTVSPPPPPAPAPAAEVKKEGSDSDTTPVQTPLPILTESESESEKDQVQVPFPSKKESYPFRPSPVPRALQGLYWPWGQKGSLAEPVITDSPRSSSPDDKPTIPRPPSPPTLLDLPQLERSRSSSTSSEDSLSTASGDLPLPSFPDLVEDSSSSNSNPMSDVLYKAFVREWCWGADTPIPSASSSRGQKHTRGHGHHAHHQRHNGLEGSFGAEGMGMGIEV